MTLFFVYVVYTMMPLPVIVVALSCVLLSIMHLIVSYVVNPDKLNYANEVGLLGVVLHMPYATARSFDIANHYCFSLFCLNGILH